MFEKVSLDTFRDFMIDHGGAEMSDEQIEAIYNNIKLPKRSTEFSAGYDFFSPIGGFTLPAGGCMIIPTGVKCNLGGVTSDMGKFLALYPRSSYGFKYGMRLMNTVGIIDSDYYDNQSNEGHIIVAVTTMNPIEFKVGDRFCQGIVQPYYKLTGEDASTVVRVGGMGSTDELLKEEVTTDASN